MLSQSRLIDTLAHSKANLEALRGSLAESLDRLVTTSGKGRWVARGTIDVDGFPITARGLQTGSEYNGQYKKRVFYPLIAGFAPEGTYESNRAGDGVIHAILRRGAIHDAQGAQACLGICKTSRRAFRCRLCGRQDHGPAD